MSALLRQKVSLARGVSVTGNNVAARPSFACCWFTRIASEVELAYVHTNSMATFLCGLVWTREALTDFRTWLLRPDDPSLKKRILGKTETLLSSTFYAVRHHAWPKFKEMRWTASLLHEFSVLWLLQSVKQIHEGQVALPLYAKLLLWLNEPAIPVLFHNSILPGRMPTQF